MKSTSSKTRNTSKPKLRALISDIFTVAGRMEQIRRHLGSAIGLTGPQFSILMAVAELEGTVGVSVGQVARFLHVSGTFVTVEAGKLALKGLLDKKADEGDRRITLLSLSRSGNRARQSILPDLNRINAAFFNLESAAQFEALCRTFTQLVLTSYNALSLMGRAEENRPASGQQGHSTSAGRRS